MADTAAYPAAMHGRTDGDAGVDLAGGRTLRVAVMVARSLTLERLGPKRIWACVPHSTAAQNAP